MPDLHNHTTYCHHAEGTIAEYISQARRLGITEFGISEHSPWMFQYRGEQLAPSWAEFRSCLSDLEAARHQESKTPGLNLRIGIEMDFIPGQMEVARKFTHNYPFDYHIGSIHNIGRWMIDHPGHTADWNELNIRKVYEEYFHLMKEMFTWGIIDIVGHLDLPKKFGFLPDGGYEDLVEDIIPLIVAAGAVVEINTAGLDKPVREIYPSAKVVRMLAGAGVPFTIGSDAHTPKDVGRYRSEAISLLRECGVKELITFSRRKKMGIRI